MFVKVLACAVLFAVSALGAAVSIPTLVPVDLNTIDNPIETCGKRGIDIRGPIPTDAQPIEGGFTFAADSDASHWVRCQIALASSPDLEKRENANIGIGMFTQNLCAGQGLWTDNVQYDFQRFSTLSFYSVGIAFRGLRTNEHLDFSEFSGSDWCGTYLYSAEPMTPVGCFNSQAINCFRLSHT